MKKIHYFSGSFITVFIAFHLLNHAFAIISLEKHLAVMEIFRVVYKVGSDSQKNSNYDI